MSSVCDAALRRLRAAAWLLTALLTGVGPLRAADATALRICADPNNLPFSNSRGEGFENEIARVLASDLGRPLQYFWEPQRRGFIRTTLAAGNCDVVIGVPNHYELVQTTRPYYRSSYVFVTVRARVQKLQSLDDPRLRAMRVGIQITGEDYENPPAAQAFASRGLAGNVRGFPVYGDYSKPAPQRTIVDAVADGRIDAAVVWGPVAGYFAQLASVPLAVTPVTPPVDRLGLPFTFEIAMGVRRGDTQLRERLDAVIARRAREIRSILLRFGVPLV